MRQSGRAHYVAHNAVTRVPRSYIYLDTEAHRTVIGRQETQTFRLAVAAYDTIRKDREGWKDRAWGQFVDVASLWGWVTAHCRRKARTVLVAHNLGYDLRIADAFTHLPALGWTFVAGNVGAGTCWFMFRNGDRTLCCVDSMSWVPTGLEKLGVLCGISKLDLPDEDDDEVAWFARCTRDVEILADVWRRLMAWVECDDLGNWKLSGAGQSWAAFRHRFMEHRLLVHEDDDARAAERAAAHTGRCEAWQHGKLTGGPYAEWDFTTAYAIIGRDCDVPVKLCGEMHAPTLAKVLDASRTRAVLCEVEVTTDEPVLPNRSEAGIRWPVGRVVTTCWDNELALAIRHGGRVHVVRAWIYRRAPALSGFCSWVLDGLDGTRADVDPVVQLALKHWSRALIGRTAAQWSRWEPWGEAPSADVMLSTCRDVPADETYALLQLGTQIIRQSAKPDNPDAMVAIMSWVMAESRVRLWKAMQVSGLSNVAYVDTDSLIVNSVGTTNLARAKIPGLRIKGEWTDLEILGPRQIIPGHQLRAAGVPVGAVRVADRAWEAGVWSGLASGLSRGSHDAVQVTHRRFELRGTDNRRRHLPKGLTEAYGVNGDELEGMVG